MSVGYLRHASCSARIVSCARRRSSPACSGSPPSAVLAAAGACSEPLEASFVPDDHNYSPNGPSCLEDSHCVPAGPTCCGCPTFAVSIGDPVARACANVKCPASECAENVVARCNEDQQCELACAPRTCGAASTACQYGFATDANGCLTCECATPAPNGCAVDADCTRTRADCCGCQLGGFDTAVLVTERASFEAKLDCKSTPAVPRHQHVHRRYADVRAGPLRAGLARATHRRVRARRSRRRARPGPSAW